MLLSRRVKVADALIFDLDGTLFTRATASVRPGVYDHWIDRFDELPALF
jgi:hypothetical protein